MSFLFVDRILEFIPGKKCTGLKHVTTDDIYTYQSGNNVCFNPSMIGETLGQLAAWNVMFSTDFKMRPVAGVVETANLLREVKVGETLFLEAEIDTIDEEAIQYSAKASVDGVDVFTLSRSIGPLLPMKTFIDEELVKSQFNIICRPGEWVGNSNLESDFPVSNLQQRQPAVKLTYDRVLEHDPGVRVVGYKKVSHQAPYFPDHFPNKPVLPMTVLLESKINLAYQFIGQANLEKSYKLKGLRKIKMNDFVYPGDEVVTSVIVKQHEGDELVLRFRSEVARKRVCVMEMVMTATDAVC